MVFKRMAGAFGADAPSMETFLTTSRTQPGGTLSGEVRLRGGRADAGVERIALGLVVRVGQALGDNGGQSGLEKIAYTQIGGPSTLRRGEERTIEFQMTVPWETPISEIGGRRLTGLALGVRAEMAGATAVDLGDVGLVAVRPVPSQQRVLQAFSWLGFHFKRAAVRTGRLAGVHQDLPFYQGIEFYAPSRHAGVVHEVGLAFFPSLSGLAVILEANPRSGRSSSDSSAGHFRMSHAEALHTDWPSEVDRWLDGLGHHIRGQSREQWRRARPDDGR
ncbi:sporulation protein [Nonomuraea sp. NPDC002799]